MIPTDDELRAFALWCRSNDLRHVLDPEILRRTAGAYHITSAETLSAPRKFTVDDLGNIAENVRRRLDAGEDLDMALGVALFNYGDRFARATCIAGEWTGEKHELPRTTGLPLCPSGHPLTQSAGLELALVDPETLR